MLINLASRYHAAAAPSPSFDPVTLFTGQRGFFVTSQPTYNGQTALWQDLAKTIPVTTDGDPVRVRVDFSGNAIDGIAPSDAARPIYRTDGTHHWLEYDLVDDRFDFAAQASTGDPTWSFVSLYTPLIQNFILITNPGSSDPWLCVGQEGSTATDLFSGSFNNYEFYVDGVLSSATTRGGQWTDAQATNTAEAKVTINTGISDVAIGKYNSAPFSLPGNDYGFIARAVPLTASERSDITAYAKQITGAA